MNARAVRQSVGDALATADLRRLQAAWGTSAIGSWVFFIALAIYAYDVGGAVAVGVAALARMAPAALAAPLAGLLADRHPRRDVLLIALLARAVAVAAVAGAVAADLPFALVLVLAAVFTALTTAHRPAQAALLPSLAETPRQLAAANAIWTGTDSAAFLLGSLAAGALVTGTSVETAFAVTAVLYAVAAIPIARIPHDPVPPHRAARAADLASELAHGFKEIAADPPLRTVVGFLTVATLAEGAIDVLIVVVALELLDLGNGAVGWLNACWGLGGLVGGVAALALLGSGRLAAGLAAGGILVGGSLLLIAGIPAAVTAVVALTVLGVGYALVETAGLSLLQRLSSDEVLGRAFAVVESTYWLATGLGAIAAPVLVELLGAEGALLATGGLLLLAVALRWGVLTRLEAGAQVKEPEFRALRSVPIFGALPLATVENVSQRLVEVRVPAGDVLMRQGDHGDRFYVIADGWTDVDQDGERLRACGPGDVLGEIALLRDCPRTATVTARTDVLLYALERDAFIGAVSGSPRWSTAVRESADLRLSEANQPREETIA